MTSVFKKLLRREFGKSKYDSLTKMVKENFHIQKNDSSQLYQILYEELKGRDSSMLKKMNERLNDSMLHAFQITKTFGFTAVIYLISFFTLAFSVEAIIAVPAIIVISGIVLLKAYEYVINRFSRIDLYIILVYKAVLERLMVDVKGE